VTDALESLRIHAIGRVTACAERLDRVAHGHVLLYNQGKLRVLIALTDRRAEGLRVPDGIDPAIALLRHDPERENARRGDLRAPNQQAPPAERQPAGASCWPISRRCAVGQCGVQSVSMDAELAARR
jgi:hypothetical protein